MRCGRRACCSSRPCCLLGYLYAYVLGRLANLRVQLVVHVALMALGLSGVAHSTLAEARFPVATLPRVAWELLQLIRTCRAAILCGFDDSAFWFKTGFRGPQHEAARIPTSSMPPAMPEAFWP